MPVPFLGRAIRRRHSAVDEERGGHVIARHSPPGCEKRPRFITKKKKKKTINNMHNKYNQQCNYSGITMMAALWAGKSKIDQSQTIKIQNTVSHLFCVGWVFIRPHRCSGTNHSSSWTGRRPSGSLPFCLF